MPFPSWHRVPSTILFSAFWEEFKLNKAGCGWHLMGVLLLSFLPCNGCPAPCSMHRPGEFSKSVWGWFSCSHAILDWGQRLRATGAGDSEQGHLWSMQSSSAASNHACSGWITLPLLHCECHPCLYCVADVQLTPSCLTCPVGH